MLTDQLPNPRRPRRSRTDPGPFAPWIDSWMLHLRSEDKAPKTMKAYRDAAVLIAGWLIERGRTDWDQVTKDDLRDYWIWMYDQSYAKSTVNQHGRSLQQFWKWWSEEEDVPSPFTKSPPAPKMGENPPAVLEQEQLVALIKDAEKGRDYESRRDAAILRLFACTGCRLSELANLQLDDVNVAGREATVTGKGSKRRTVKYDHKAALALDRYLRVRAKHKAASLLALWIGTRRRTPMTSNGVYQMIARRGERLGMKINPHQFRHTFSHRWLDAGGAEGDLLELNGWESAQMLKLYGRSARSARARRAYDRVDVMGGL